LNDQFYKELNRILLENQIKLHERLEYHTSLHIGGPADYLVTPRSIDEIIKVIDLCKQYSIPYYIIGNGSNLLVSDKGYRGLIIKFDEHFSNISISEDGLVTAQAGVMLSRLAHELARQEYSGFEFACGIPGTLGGAVTMNASAYDGEMKQCIIGAKVLSSQGKILDLTLDELQLGYRTSILQKENYILLEATMKFAKGDKQQIISKMKELNGRRRDKQPLEQYSAGSTFKRPQGYYAGKLIQDAGLSGYQVGGAAVSEKHCGFVINKDGATAKDFYQIIQDIKAIVKEKFGVELEPEVKMLGEF